MLDARDDVVGGTAPGVQLRAAHYLLIPSPASRPSSRPHRRPLSGMGSGPQEASSGSLTTVVASLTLPKVCSPATTRIRTTLPRSKAWFCDELQAWAAVFKVATLPKCRPGSTSLPRHPRERSISSSEPGGSAWRPRDLGEAGCMPIWSDATEPWIEAPCRRCVVQLSCGVCVARLYGGDACGVSYDVSTR